MGKTNRLRKWSHKVVPLICFVAIIGGVCWLLSALGWVTFGDSDSNTKIDLDDNHPVKVHARYVDSVLSTLHKPIVRDTVIHPIYGVEELDSAFNDLNDIQFSTAEVLGISALQSRGDIARYKGELEDISTLPNLRISEQMTHSLPYMVPRAAQLLEHIASTFRDSLQVKGYSPHDLVVTSALRTEDDLARLRKSNRNASAKSCHRYGTTFDISYHHFYAVDKEMEVSESKLKDILAEVLWEYRKRELCYIKYEKRQACFHITAR